MIAAKNYLKKTKIIKADLSNETSIRNAEKQKLRLENLGWNLIAQDVGMFHLKLVYTK